MAAITETCQAHLKLETRQAHVRLETREAQLKLLKEMRYHPGSKIGSLLRLMEVMLWIRNMPAIQGTHQAHKKAANASGSGLETRQAHIKTAKKM